MFISSVSNEDGCLWEKKSGSVQVGENDVDEEDEFAKCCREEWGDKCWDKEDDRKDGLKIVRKLLVKDERIIWQCSR